MLVALIVRLGAIAATPHYAPGADAAEYDRYATSIAGGHGYPESPLVAAGGPTAFRPPAYPIFLAAVYKLPGPNWTEGRVAQALLGTAIVALIGILAAQIWDRRMALAAMAVAAVYPPLIVLGAELITEPLFVALELASIAAVIEHRRSERRYLWAAVAGLLVGLATMTRVNGVLMALPLAIALWTGRPRRAWQSWAAPLIFIAVTVAAMAPWTIRNAVQLHAFIPLSTQGDFALARNYNQAALDDPTHPSAPHNTPAMLAIVRDPSRNEPQAASELGGDARAFMRDHPGYVVQTLIRNTARAFHLDGLRLGETSDVGLGVDRWLADAGIYGLYAFAILALAGAFLPAARRTPWFFWLTPVTAFLPALLIAAGRTRYRAPIDPFIVILAGIAIVWAWERVSERRSSEPQPASSPAP